MFSGTPVEPAKTLRVAFMLDLQWPYKRHADVFAGAQQYASEQGWETVVDEFAAETLRRVKAGEPGPYDGIIARATPQLARAAARRKVPLVNVWGSSPVRARTPSAIADFDGIGTLCAQHLVSRGLRHFAVITASDDLGQTAVWHAFARVTREAGFECRHECVPLYPQENVAAWRLTNRVITECLDACQKPLGMYVTDEYLGRILLQNCRQRGLRVPADVAIVTGYNEATVCEHLKPSLTSVDLGYHKLGYEAARLLGRLMRGEPPPDQAIVVPSPGLVMRESTDFAVVSNETVTAALAFIAANAHRRIGQDDVARGIGVETRTLQNYFRKHLGRPIVTEIRRVRIERAKRELALGTRTLSEIASAVGFGTTMRMYEVFCRDVGISPTAYRTSRKA